MAKRKVLRRRRVKLISTNRVDGDLTDIVFEEEVAVKARKRRVNHDVPDMIESRIVPSLFFTKTPYQHGS